jgi:cell division septal protein FtsQ
VSKVFPSTLKIEVKERTPLAVLKKVNLYLVDRDGVLLEQINPEAKINLPLLTDSNNFVEGYKDKLELAWRCLDGLSPQEKKQVESLDLTDDENLALRLRNSPTKLIIGNDQFSKKIKLFQEYQAKLEKLGQLEYTDLRFPGRFYVKLNKGSSGESTANFRKEAN